MCHDQRILSGIEFQTTGAAVEVCAGWSGEKTVCQMMYRWMCEAMISRRVCRGLC